MADDRTPRCGNCRWHQRSHCSEPRLLRINSTLDAGGNNMMFMAPARTDENALCNFHAAVIVTNNYRNADTGEPING